MLSVISTIVQWIIVPCIMLALLVFALIIVAGTQSNSESRTSAWAGFWAGLVMFVIFVVSQLSSINQKDFDFSYLPGFVIVPIVFGIIVGFFFLWIVILMSPTRLVGLLTLALSAISTSALFAYFFIYGVRVEILYSMLAIALGILLHIVLFSATLREIFG